MGALKCLLSATGFGLMAVFAKLAYDDGVTVEGLLLVRFGAAAVVLLLLARSRGVLTGLSRRAVVSGLALGAVGYAAQAAFYLAAVDRVAASLVALVFCVYPVLVMVGAILLRWERASGRRVLAVVVALTGIVLVLGGAGGAHFEVLGVGLALGSALVYTCYILVSDRAGAGVPALALAALVCTGAFGTFAASTVVRGVPDLGFAPRGWLWLGLLVAVSTVGAIVLFFAGLSEVGPTVAALLASVEPLVTILSAAVVFGESLGAVQVVGAGLVLGAVLVVQWPSRGRPEIAVCNDTVVMQPRDDRDVAHDLASPLAVP